MLEPVRLTALPLPMAALAKTATADKVTSSVPIFVRSDSSFVAKVAELLLSYALLLAVNVPPMVSSLAVILADVIGEPDKFRV